MAPVGVLRTSVCGGRLKAVDGEGLSRGAMYETGPLGSLLDPRVRTRFFLTAQLHNSAPSAMFFGHLAKKHARARFSSKSNGPPQEPFVKAYLGAMKFIGQVPVREIAANHSTSHQRRCRERWPCWSVIGWSLSQAPPPACADPWLGGSSL